MTYEPVRDDEGNILYYVCTETGHTMGVLEYNAYVQHKLYSMYGEMCQEEKEHNHITETKK